MGLSARQPITPTILCRVQEVGTAQAQTWDWQIVWAATSIGSFAQGSYCSVYTTAQFHSITRGTEPTGLERFTLDFTLQSVCALSQQDRILSSSSFHPTFQQQTRIMSYWRTLREEHHCLQCRCVFVHYYQVAILP